MNATASWARLAFGAGYAEHGPLPVPPMAVVRLRAIQESHLTGPAVGRLIIEAGRAEGKRAKRERAHKRLYDFHAAELAAALLLMLQRMDADEVARQVVENAATQTRAGASAVVRHRAVASQALTAITAHVHGDDRQELAALNAQGWAHATAYGIGEAQASSGPSTDAGAVATAAAPPIKGGPPDPALVAAAAATALKAIPTAEAATASATWTDLELQTVAMGAALAAGDGSAVDEAVRKVKARLVDTGRATKVYADQLHGAVNRAFVGHLQRLYTTVQINWVVNSGNPCPTCTANQAASPYPATQLPTYPPLHPGCLCNLELASAQLPVLASVTAT